LGDFDYLPGLLKAWLTVAAFSLAFKTLLFLKKKKQKDFFSWCCCGMRRR
jgi:hypothetical protein